MVTCSPTPAPPARRHALRYLRTKTKFHLSGYERRGAGSWFAHLALGPAPSERVLQSQENSSVTAVCGGFIEETGIGDARFGNTVVAGIRQIEEVHAKLKPVGLRKQPHSLRDAQIHVADPVATQDVAAQAPEAVTRGTRQGRADAGAWRERTEKRAATRLPKFLEGHAGNRKVRVEIGSNRISHQRVDTTKRCRWIRTVQRPERGAALQREESTELPASQQAAEGTRLASTKRQFVNSIHRESVRPVVGGAGPVCAPVERVLSQGHFSANRRVERV